MLPDTIKTQAAYIPTPLQAAQNELAIAMARCIRNPTAENQKAVKAARDRVDQEKTHSNNQRREVLAAVCANQPKERRFSWFSILPPRSK